MNRQLHVYNFDAKHCVFLVIQPHKRHRIAILPRCRRTAVVPVKDIDRDPSLLASLGHRMQAKYGENMPWATSSEREDTMSRESLKPSTRVPPDPRAAALAGAMSGTAAVSITYPLDLLRTRLALERAIPPPSVFSMMRRVLVDEGTSALFRGIRPAVASHAPAAAIFFSIYTRMQQYVPTASVNAQISASASIAWVTTCCIMNPMWVVKTRCQAQASGMRVKASALKYGGILQTMRLVYKEQGLRGLYCGTLAACAGAPGAAIQMPIYEFWKRGGLPGSSFDDPPSPARIAIASAGSAAIVSVITFPADVVRLRLQAQEMRGPENVMHSSTRYSGILDAVRTIFKQEGIASFYRGLSASLVRTVPNSAIGLLTFETMLRITSTLVSAVDSAAAPVRG